MTKSIRTHIEAIDQNQIGDNYKEITIEMVRAWGNSPIGSNNYRDDYLLEILRGDYSLDEAREDILSFQKES